MIFIELSPDNEKGIEAMSAMATEIVRDQLEHGYRYYFVKEDDRLIGFLAFYPKGEVLYLSKLYLYKSERGKGYSRQMLDFVIQAAEAAGLHTIELNVNRNNDAINAYEKLGFLQVL